MRQFVRGDLIPDDVEAVIDPDGMEYVRDRNGLFRGSDHAQPGYLSANTARIGPKPLCAGWFDYEFPLTEIEVEA